MGLSVSQLSKGCLVLEGYLLTTDVDIFHSLSRQILYRLISVQFEFVTCRITYTRSSEVDSRKKGQFVFNDFPGLN